MGERVVEDRRERVELNRRAARLDGVFELARSLEIHCVHVMRFGRARRERERLLQRVVSPVEIPVEEQPHARERHMRRSCAAPLG